MRTTLFLQLFLMALWFGGGVALMFVAAPAAFAASPDRTTAANVVGVMLNRWHYLALLAPTLLLAIDWKGGLHHTARVVLLAAAIVLAATQVFVDAKVRAMRQSSATPISELAADDPFRRSFGMMHGISSVTMLVQVLCAAGVLWTITQPPRGYHSRPEIPAERSIDL